jgi:hypothetical protein
MRGHIVTQKTVLMRLLLKTLYIARRNGKTQENQAKRDLA